MNTNKTSKGRKKNILFFFFLHNYMQTSDQQVLVTLGIKPFTIALSDKLSLQPKCELGEVWYVRH